MLVPAVPATAQGPAPAAGDSSVVAVGAPLAGLSPGVLRRLSDETTITRWAYARRRALIFTQPSDGSRSIGRLRYYSSSGADEIYGVLNVTVDGQQRKWLQIRVPMRPNGRTGWVLEDSLGRLQVVRTQLVIDRGALTATLYKDGGVLMTTRVGVGKAGTPTPSGRYFISARVRGSRFGPAYGAWAFLTTAYSRLLDWPGGGVVGIHGTNQPGLVPGRPSHGCVRMRNPAIRKLARLMPTGTPVLIR